MRPLLFILAMTAVLSSTVCGQMTKYRNNVLSSLIEDKTDEVYYGFRKMDYSDIDAVIIHSTYYIGSDSFNIDGIMKQFKRYKVGAHYIIGRDGTVYKTIDENNIAYHAGKSHILGENSSKSVNSRSIGIEIINSPSQPPTQAQYRSLLILVEDIRSRYPIKHILGHCDIAPGRKTDPWSFNWETFRNNLSKE